MPTQSAIIATAVRARIKTGRQDGTLAIPGPLKVSVTSRDGIDVTLIGAVPDGWTDNDRWTPEAREVGERIADIIRAERDKVSNGWQWCSVRFVSGRTLATVARSGWTPGQD